MMVITNVNLLQIRSIGMSLSLSLSDPQKKIYYDGRKHIYKTVVQSSKHLKCLVFDLTSSPPLLECSSWSIETHQSFYHFIVHRKNYPHSFRIPPLFPQRYGSHKNHLEIGKNLFVMNLLRFGVTIIEFISIKLKSK